MDGTPFRSEGQTPRERFWEEEMEMIGAEF